MTAKVTPDEFLQRIETMGSMHGDDHVIAFCNATMKQVSTAGKLAEIEDIESAIDLPNDWYRDADEVIRQQMVAILQQFEERGAFEAGVDQGYKDAAARIATEVKPTDLAPGKEPLDPKSPLGQIKAAMEELSVEQLRRMRRHDYDESLTDYSKSDLRDLVFEMWTGELPIKPLTEMSATEIVQEALEDHDPEMDADTLADVLKSIRAFSHI